MSSNSSLDNRREANKLELRQKILEAASELFLEQGYSGFSLRKVAERIGYSATTLYLYFKNKDDLLFQVSLEGFEQFGQALQVAYDSQTDPIARIHAIGRAYVQFGLDHPAHYQLMFLQKGDFLARVNPHNAKPTIDSFDILVQAVRQAHQAGVMRGDDVMHDVYSLWAGVHGLTSLHLCTPTLLCQETMHLQVEHLLALQCSGYRK